MLNYTYYPYTPQVHLPRPGPTISYYGFSPPSATSQRRVHNWGGMPHFPLWSPALWGVVPQLSVPPPLGGIPTPRQPHVLPLSP